MLEAFGLNPFQIVRFYLRPALFVVQIQLHGLVDYPDEDSDDDNDNIIDDAAVKTEDQPPAKKLRVSL